MNLILSWFKPQPSKVMLYNVIDRQGKILYSCLQEDTAANFVMIYRLKGAEVYMDLVAR